MCFGRFKIQLTPLTKWPAIWILNSSAISSAMQRISKRQNANFQYHTKCHTLCNLLVLLHVRGAGPSHAHPIFLGEWDAIFCVGSMQNYYAAISRAPCMRGNAYHADRDRGRAEGSDLPLWVGFKCSLPFPTQSSGQKKCAVLRLPVGNQTHDLSWH